jgi:RimJ/RimL family protein N-acetyltransferase
MTTITTPHLTLGSIRECDFDELIALMKNEEVSKTYMVPDLPTREAEMKLFARLCELSASNDRYVYGIFLEERLIGMLNDTDICGKTIEVGYAIHPAYSGKGYATEALTAIIPHLFSVGFEEVIAGAFECNPASLRVMEKSGMKRSNLTASVEYRGVTHKCIYYSIKK